MLTTTLSAIRSHSPCADGWRTLTTALGSDYGDDTPLPIARIVETNGVVDALWAFRCVEESKPVTVQFAIECAERVLPRFEAKCPNDVRPRKAIEAAKAWLHEPSAQNAVAAHAAARVASAAYASAASAAYAASSASASSAAAAVNAAAAAAVDAYAYAAHAAARVASASASSSAAAAHAAERDWQKQRLIELCNLDNAEKSK